jgi:hypothetical protein
MADSKGNVEERLARLEEAVVNIAGILVDQSARIDYGFRVARDENQALRRELRAEMQELRTSVTERIDTLSGKFDAVTDRLDRLIAATLRSGTQTADRLADIELRLTKLEDRDQH